MLVAVTAVISACVGVGVVMYMMSGEVRNRAQERGPFRRLLQSIPLQSVKIVIVAWQILTQVRNPTFDRRLCG